MNKISHVQNDITLVHNNKIITEKQNTIKTFNDHYIYIVEKSCGTKPTIMEKIFHTNSSFHVK